MLLRQILVSAVSSATLLSAGMNVGFSAVSLPHMLDQNGPDKLTVEEGSWFASMTFITILLGCLTCGPMMDGIGRRNTLLVINTPFIIGWLLQGLAPEPVPLTILYIGRLLNGLGGGMISIPANLYIAEMATSKMRCMLVTWPSLYFSSGILLVYALGLVTDSWRVIANISALVPVIALISIFLFAKETPFWLLSKGRRDEAESSFRWIRGLKPVGIMPDDMKKEFEGMIKRSYSPKSDSQESSLREPLRKGNESYYGSNGTQIFAEQWIILDEKKQQESFEKKPSHNMSMMNGPEVVAKRSYLEECLMALKRPDVWKPLVILNSFFFFMEFSGVPVLVAYGVNIMMSEGVPLDPYFATVLVGCIKLIAESGASFIHNRYGRRPLSVISGFGMTACMVGLGLQHQYLADLKTSEHSALFSWIPLFLIFGYVISAALGFFMLPWAMLGEVYPTKVAGMACGITTLLGNMFGFLAIKIFPSLVILLGGFADGNQINCTQDIFYLYGIITSVAVVFILLYLPETFGRTIQEISEEFINPPKRRNKCCGY